MKFERRTVEVETPELGKVLVRDVSMLLGIRFANAVAVVPDEEFSFFHESLTPIYLDMIVESVLDETTREPMFSDTQTVEELSFDTFTLLVRTLRRQMIEDQQQDLEEAKKN